MAGGYFGFLYFFRVRFLSPEMIRRRMHGSVGQYINTWTMVLFVMAQAVAVYGLLLFLVGALLADFLVLGGASLVTLLWLRPQEDKYFALVRHAANL